jgi:hypothetical protein
LRVAAAASVLRELGQHGISASDAITLILVAAAAIALLSLLSAVILPAFGPGRTAPATVAGTEPANRR